MDFFPNDVLMPTDGTWFFPVAGINTSLSGNGLDGGNGMSRENWMSTTGIGFGWSMGGGQNVDWGFGGTDGNPDPSSNSETRDS